MLTDRQLSIHAGRSQREQDAPAPSKCCAVQTAPCLPLHPSPALHHAPETAARHSRPCCIGCQPPGIREEANQCKHLVLVLEVATLLLHFSLHSHSHLRQGPSANTYPQSAAGEALLQRGLRHSFAQMLCMQILCFKSDQWGCANEGLQKHINVVRLTVCTKHVRALESPVSVMVMQYQ